MSRFIRMQKLAWSLKAVASERRLHILRYLNERERALQEIATKLEVSNATAFFHMHKLRREHYVQARRFKRNTYYALTLEFRKSSLSRKILA